MHGTPFQISLEMIVYTANTHLHQSSTPEHRAEEKRDKKCNDCVPPSLPDRETNGTQAEQWAEDFCSVTLFRWVFRLDPCVCIFCPISSSGWHVHSQFAPRHQFSHSSGLVEVLGTWDLVCTFSRVPSGANFCVSLAQGWPHRSQSQVRNHFLSCCQSHCLATVSSPGAMLVLSVLSSPTRVR